MARKYAAIMALIGLLVVMMRTLKNGGSFETAVTSGIVWMIVLGIVGVVIGSIAEMTVVESVRLRLEEELAQRQKEKEQREQSTAVESAAESVA